MFLVLADAINQWRRTMKSLSIGIFTVAALLVLPCFALGQPAAGQPQMPPAGGMTMPTEAVAVLVPMSGSKVEGTILLRQEGDTLHVTGKVSGLKEGKHGFHIHEFGDLRDKEGKSAGGHFNPTGMPHGAPDAGQHHMGDFGNIEAGADGTANVDLKMSGVPVMLTLGRSIVVHADPDDLKTQPSGNAGARVGVGVIGVAEVKK
jgi:Cu-Zn family superoxide dismutase